VGGGRVRPPFTCVYRETWDDERFWSLDHQSRLVYLYILTAPLGNGLGLYKAGLASLIEDFRASECGMTEKCFRKGFANGLSNGLFKYDERVRVVYIPKYFERNPPSNPNGIKALGKDFVRVPDCQLKVECYQAVRAWVEPKKESFGESFDQSFEEPLSEPPGNVTCPCPPSPSVSPSPTDTTSPGDDFNQFWSVYPKKVGKLAAERAWKTAKKNRKLPSIETVIEAVERQKASENWQKKNGQYIPGPQRWINEGRWMDEQTKSALDEYMERSAAEAAAEEGDVIDVEFK
jgi:hypothetical protein